MSRARSSCGRYESSRQSNAYCKSSRYQCESEGEIEVECECRSVGVSMKQNSESIPKARILTYQHVYILRELLSQIQR